MFTTPTLQELQRPKLTHRLPLLPATSTQSFMQFRYMVTEKCHQNVIRVCDDLYHSCAFVRCCDAETSVILLLLDMPDMLFAKFWRGQCSVFSRDIIKGGILAC